MKTWRPSMRSLLLALAACLGLAATAQAQPEQSKIAIGVTGVSNFVGVWVAADHGLFEKHGLTADITLVKEGSVAVAGIVSGSLTFATPTPSVFLQAVDKGLDLVVAAPTNEFPSPNLIGVLAQPNSGIKDARDLVGKRFGVPGIGGLQDVLVHRWLMDSGVDPEKLTYVELTFPQMPDALKARQVDALTAGEPFYQRIVDGGLGVQVKDLRTIITPGTLGGLYGASRDWVKTHPKTLAAFRATLADALDIIAKDPEEGKKSIAKWLKLSPETMALISIPNLTLKTDPQQMAFWIDVCLQQKMISNPIKAADVIWP